MLLHIQSFRVERSICSPTLWQRLTPQTRILCLAVAVIANVSTPNGQWLTWGLYGVVAIAFIALSRVSWSLLLSRLAIELAFLIVILLGTLFRGGGNVVWAWGIFRITSEGLTVLGSVTAKAVISLLWANLLVLTTPIPQLLQALLSLRFPPVLVAIMASMYRYLNLLIGEFTTMRRAALARNLMLTPQNTRKVLGHTIGSLFIRTVDRGERIYQAMLARGYRETLFFAKLPAPRALDACAIAFILAVAALGQILAWHALSKS
jgi:cobalt/nickel transport system permease protein